MKVFLRPEFRPRPSSGKGGGRAGRRLEMTFPAKSNNKAQSEGSARIMAATLTLVAREQRPMPPPYSIWNPRLDPGEIQEMALEVAGGKAHAVWVDDSHPARGLLIIRERELESEILGYGSAMLKGPYLVDPDPVMRGGATSLLVRKGSELAGSLGRGSCPPRPPRTPPW